MMRTDEVAGLLPAYVAGSLEPGQAGQVAEHVAGCESCRREIEEWRAIAEATRTAAFVPAPSRGLIDRVFERLDAEERPPARYQPLVRFKRPFAALAASLALVAVLVATPVGTLAQQLLEVFQPKQFVLVPVTEAELRALPSLNDYGDFTQRSHGESRRVATAAEASAATGLSLVTPTTLPAGIPDRPSAYQVVPSSSATFVFSAARAAETARARGTQLPPMPPNIDGSSVQMTTGNAVVTIYGERDTGAGAAGGLPRLLTGQAFVPTATSTGASARDLQQYLLSQPGISEDLAKAVRAIGDPTTVWPIPVPAGKLRTRPVTVQGVPGTLFSDDGGFVTGVVWVKDGQMYGVGGPLSEGDVLAVAGSLR